MNENEMNVENMEIVGQAISNYLKSNNLTSKPIIIGYDTRNNSRLFAETIARIFIHNNIPVRFTISDAPTPVVATLILHFKTGGGVMITASHNPPEYNGIKFIPYYASPAMPEITNKLMDEITKLQNQSIKIEKFNGNLTSSSLYNPLNPLDLYIKKVIARLNIKSIRSRKYTIVIDPLYGTARHYLEQLLKKLNCQVFKIHSEVDPNFGGKNPDPNLEILKELSELVIEKSADAGLSCDGDGDRSGIIDDLGQFIDANNMFGLLFKYDLDRGLRGDIVRTVATTHLIDRIARDYNLTVYETPVGSKYIGQYMREKDLLIGGESSGGIMFRGHIPEKDGIFSDMKIVEMMAFYKKKLSEIYKDLIGKYGRILFRQISVKCSDELKDKVMNSLSFILPEIFGGLKIMKKIQIDGFKFVLEDGSWLLIRKSGTEPLLRLACESTKEETLNKLINEGEKFLISAQQKAS